jgi:rod shape-determining protein MreC
MLFLFRLLRNNLFPVTFFILFIVSVMQVVRFNLYQKSFYFNSTRSVLNSTSKIQSSVYDYFNLKDINARLVTENAEMHNQEKQNLLFEDTTVKVFFDSSGKRRYGYLVCKVIKSSTRLRNNFITLDKGSASGIKKGMAVIAPGGIVGLVFDVTDNFSLVLSVLNSKFVTTPMIPAIGFREGSVTWNGQDPGVAQLNWVNKFEALKPGMKVMTSNFSVKFPPGIPIGTIKNVRKKSTSSFYEIDLNLATDFRRLGYVYVVTDHFRQQLDSLEQREVQLAP